MALSCRFFRIIAVLVISGKQPLSGLLQLCGFYLCVLAKLSATVVLFNIFSTSRKHFVFQAILSHRAITSTNVDGTASQTTVPGYHTLTMTGYEALCVSGGLRRLRVYCCRRVLWRAHPSFRILIFLDPPGFGNFGIFFRGELSAFCWRPHGVNPLAYVAMQKGVATLFHPSNPRLELGDVVIPMQTCGVDDATGKLMCFIEMKLGGGVRDQMVPFLKFGVR